MPADEIVPTPVESPSMLAAIDRQLDGIKDKSAAAILQVPVDGRLRGGVYVNVGKGLSFAGWLEHDLAWKPDQFGWGVAVRKSWG